MVTVQAAFPLPVLLASHQTSNPPTDGLTYSLPLLSASRLNPSMSLASLRLHSPWRTWGSALGFVEPQTTSALKARVSRVCSFPIPYALVTLQTERALDFASPFPKGRG